MSKLRDIARSPDEKDKQNYSMNQEKYQKPNSEVLEELEKDKKQNFENKGEDLTLVN